MENADKSTEFNATVKGSQSHDPTSGGGHGGVPGGVSDGHGGVRINHSMDSHSQQSMNMSKDGIGNVTKAPNINATGQGQADGVLPQANRPTGASYNGPNPNVDPFSSANSSGGLPHYMENSGGNKQGSYGHDSFGGYYGNRNNGNYGMNQHGGLPGSGTTNAMPVSNPSGSYQNYDGSVNSRSGPSYPNMNRSGMGSPMGPGPGAPGYGGTPNARGYGAGPDRISSSAPTLSQLLQGQKHPSHSNYGNYSGQGDVNMVKGSESSVGMMGQGGPYQSQWSNRGHVQHPVGMYPGQRSQMGMMPEGQSPMQKRPYGGPGGQTGPYQNQYGGRQYSGMSPQVYPNPMYAGNRSYNMPGPGGGGNQFPQQQMSPHYGQTSQSQGMNYPGPPSGYTPSGNGAGGSNSVVGQPSQSMQHQGPQWNQQQQPSMGPSGHPQQPSPHGTPQSQPSQDLSGALDDLPTGCDFNSQSSAGSTSNSSSHPTPNTSNSNNLSSSSSTAPPLSPATSVHSPHVHPSVTALRPSPSPVGSPSSHISRSSLSPASVHGGPVTPQSSQPSSNPPDGPSSQAPTSTPSDSRGNFGRPGMQGYGSHHGNLPNSLPNNAGNMNFDQRMRNSSGGSNTSSKTDNSQHGGYNSNSMPNTVPNSMGGRGAMSPTYGFGPNAPGQMHRTDSMGSGPSPGVSPGPSPGPGGSSSSGGVPNAAGSGGGTHGAQAAAAAAVAAAAAATSQKRNQLAGSQPPHLQGPQGPQGQFQQGQFPPHQQQWGAQGGPQGYRHQQFHQGQNGPHFPGGPGDNANQMPSSMPNDVMHPGYMHPSSANQMPSGGGPAVTIANTVAGGTATTVTQSITTPVASSISSFTPSTPSESSRDAPTPGTPHSIHNKDDSMSSRPPSVHSRPSPMASPSAMSKSSQEDMANTPSPGLGMQPQPPPPYPQFPQQPQHQQFPQPPHLQQHQQPQQQQPYQQQQPPPQQTPPSAKKGRGQNQNQETSKFTSLNLPKKLYKQYELCPHPDRKPFLDRLFKFMEDRGQPIRTTPQIASNALDLFKLYHAVKDKGGVVKVSKAKQWKQIANEISVGSSNSAAFTLKKNYIKHLLAYECIFERGGIDPGQILAEIDATASKKAAKEGMKAMNHHPGPNDPYGQFGPPGGKPGFPPMSGQMHGGYGPPSMYGNNMGPMGPMGPGPQHNMPNSSMPGPMHGGPGGDMGNSNSITVCDPFSDMDYQHNNLQQQQGPGFPGQNAMNGSFPPSSHSGPMNHQFRNNMGGPGPGPGPAPGAGNPPFSGPPGTGHNDTDPYSLPNRNMPCNDPYAMNSYTRRGSMDPFSGPGSGPSPGPGINQPNSQFPGGPHPPPAGNFDQNRFSASPSTNMSPGPNQGPPSSQAMMPPYSTSSTPEGQQQAPFPSRFGQSGSSRPTTPSESHTSASSSPFLPPPYSTAGPSPAKQSQSQPTQQHQQQPPSSQAGPPGQQPPPQSNAQPPAPILTPPKGQTPPQPSTQSGPAPGPGQAPAPQGPVGPGPFPGPQGQSVPPSSQHPPTGQQPPPSSQAGPPAQFNNDSRMHFPQKRPSDVFPPAPKRPDYMGGHGDSGPGPGPTHSGPNYHHGMPPYGSQHQQGSYPPQGGYGGSDRSMGPGSYPPMYNDRQQPPPHPGPPHGAGAKRDGMPGDQYGKGMPPPASSHSGMGPSPSWGSVQHRDMQRPPYSSGHPNQQMPPYGGARTLHSVLTQGMPPRPAPHPHQMPHMSPGVKPLHKQQQQVYGSNQQKKEPAFPPDSVEATQPLVTKTKRKTSKDIGAVEARRLVMSLKSGLLSESTWALEVLSVLLFDNNTVMYFELSQMKGLLEVICEHFRALLIELFGTFEDLEIRTIEELKLLEAKQNAAVKEEGRVKTEEEKTEAEFISEAASSPDIERLRGADKVKPIRFDGTMSGNICNKQDWDVFEGFQSGTVHWQEGGGDMTRHVLRLFDRIESDLDEESEERKTTIEWLRHCSEELKAIRDNDVDENEKHVLYVSESKKKLGEVVLEDEEQSVNDTPSLVTTSDVRNTIGYRCVCVSNILRSLSFIPGNDAEMASHPGLLSILSRLLLLKHRHPRRKDIPQTYDRDDPDDMDVDSHNTSTHRWWSDHLDCMRENALVTITNMGGVLDVSKYVERVTLPMLDGLLHWAVCLSACALDPFPSVSHDPTLTPQRLAIESLAKLSIQQNNVDMILATPPFHRLERLFATLTQYLGERSDPVMRELSLVLLSNVARSDLTASRAIATKNSSISFLLRYIEDNEYAMSCEKTPHMVNPDIPKPSRDMMRRAGDALASLAKVPANKSLFLQHQNRLLNLSMSPLLDAEVKERIASALYELSL